MKTYHIFFSDHPWMPLKVKAKNLTEARRAGRLYIRQWQLNATIDRIEVKQGDE